VNKSRNMEELISYIIADCIQCDYTDEYAAELMVLLVRQIMSYEHLFPESES